MIPALGGQEGHRPDKSPAAGGTLPAQGGGAAGTLGIGMKKGSATGTTEPLKEGNDYEYDNDSDSDNRFADNALIFSINHLDQSFSQRFPVIFKLEYPNG